MAAPVATLAIDLARGRSPAKLTFARPSVNHVERVDRRVWCYYLVPGIASNGTRGPEPRVGVRMIKRFGTLYAGHVDFEDLGYDATPVNRRSLPNERLVTTFDKARAIAETMDRLGYDTLWLAEHHFQPEGYECIPNIL
ncbi:MAG TPA: hypothetical protein VKT80_16460, partial [Chloroflexota bacterium]|nr:hypothetical protein [Chloroflexota bacterium]